MAKIAKVQEVDISALKPYERNAKQHKPEQVRKLCESIAEFGFISPCLIDQDLNVIAGHGRIMAAKEIGMQTVPCVFVEGLTDAQRRAYILADNRLTELGEWNMDLVQDELRQLAEMDFRIELTGFDTDLQFDDSMASISDDGWTKEDSEEAAEEPIAKRGQVWKLGRHRLMCGDSTDPEQVAILMDGQQADLLLTDPPYNVALGERDESRQKSDRRPRQEDGTYLINDNMAEDDFIRFLGAAFVNAREALKPGGAFYIWYASNTTFSFLQALQAAGLQLRQILIWNKNRFTLGRQDYQWKHEPCLYGWKDGDSHYFIDDRRQATVFEDQRPDIEHMKKAEMQELLEEIYGDRISADVIDEDRPNVNELHPTMKPIKLMARMIRNSSRPGDRVLDLFGGSGSTMIACEQMDRACSMMEYDPHYADVIIQRWEKMTGQQAELLEQPSPKIMRGGVLLKAA